ncbi:RNA polymerase II transcriptional coactivator KIWI [Forsythia ovata]|uniref:RNA polymerase II transcriptional coactivator KIWI n=1 Tax=Forsythia ovata TaxID=205694 RepID=A0ABD1WGH9_9LAMI
MGVISREIFSIAGAESAQFGNIEAGLEKRRRRQYELNPFLGEVQSANKTQTYSHFLLQSSTEGEMSKRRTKRDEDEALSEGDEPPKKSSKLSAAAVDNDPDNSDHIVVCELSKNRKVFGKSWNGRVVVDIREFYYKDGKEMTGKKDKFARKGPLRCYREGSFSQQKGSRGRKELKTDKEKKFHQDSTKYLLPSSDLKGNHANHMHDSLWQLRVLPPTFEGKQVVNFG